MRREQVEAVVAGLVLFAVFIVAPVVLLVAAVKTFA